MSLFEFAIEAHAVELRHPEVTVAGVGRGHSFDRHSQVASGERQQARGHCGTVEKPAAYRLFTQSYSRRWSLRSPPRAHVERCDSGSPLPMTQGEGARWRQSYGSSSKAPWLPYWLPR